MNQRTETLSFRCEPVTDDLITEAIPLITKHWIEVGRKDIVLKPELEKYVTWYNNGFIRAYTARFNGELVGYAVFVVRTHHHYASTIWAIQDLIYLDKRHRNGWNGYQFIRYCDEALADAGVQVIHMTVSRERDFGDILERLGYTYSEATFTRRVENG